MKSIQRTLLGAVLAATAGLGMVAVTSTSTPVQAADTGAVSSSGSEDGRLLLDRLKRVRPDIPINSVMTSPVPGILEIELEGGTTLYGTADGKFMFAGDLYSIGDIELTNLAEAKRETARVEKISTIDAKDAWVFAPQGKTRAVVNVFTDIDCGYCRKLHAEVPRLNELGIEVRYLAYPRAGIGSASYNTIVSAWCSDDRGSALTAAKAGQAIPAKTCVNPVADQYQVGQEVGVTGTPAIVTSTGRLLPGYMPADILAETLGVPTS